MSARSGMPTRASAASARSSPGPTGDASLQELFNSLQLSIVGQMQEQRRDDEARRREKDAEDRRTQAAFEARMLSLEERIQVVAASSQSGLGSVGGGVGLRGGETAPLVNSVPLAPVNSVPLASVSSVESSVSPAPVSAPVVTTAAAPASGPRVLSLGYAVKPTIFDGKGPWEEYRVQFETIARANGWDDQKKATALVASLGGAARSVLTALSAAQCESFAELVSAL